MRPEASGVAARLGVEAEQLPGVEAEQLPGAEQLPEAAEVLLAAEAQ